MGGKDIYTVDVPKLMQAVSDPLRNSKSQKGKVAEKKIGEPEKEMKENPQEEETETEGSVVSMIEAVQEETGVGEERGVAECKDMKAWKEGKEETKQTDGMEVVSEPIK